MIKRNYAFRNRIALELTDITDGSRVAMATANIPDEPIAENEVIIKDYSENEGMLDVLVKNNIVSEPKRWVGSGFVQLAVCDLLI